MDDDQEEGIEESDAGPGAMRRTDFVSTSRRSRKIRARTGDTDADGARPHFVRWLQQNMPEVAAHWKKADDDFYAYWGSMPYATPG
jgi:hypothetical protein